MLSGLRKPAMPATRSLVTVADASAGYRWSRYMLPGAGVIVPPLLVAGILLGPDPNTTFMAFIAVTVLLLVAAVRPPPRVVLGVAWTMYLLSASSLSTRPYATEAIRLFAFLLVLTVFAQPGSTSARVQGHFPWRPMRLFVTLIFSFLLVASLPFGSLSLAFVAVAGVFVVHAYMSAGIDVVGGRALERVVVVCLLAVIGVSLAVGLLDPGIGVFGNRLRGLTNNPNLLGCYAFTLMALVILLQKSLRLLLLAFALGIPVLFWTASRTSSLALLSVILLASLLSIGSARKLAAVLVVVLSALASGVVGVAATITLLRTDNSRETSLETALSSIREHPVIGSGLTGAETVVSSTPFGAIVAGGLTGLGIVLVASLLLMAMSYSIGKATGVFATAFVIYGFGEGWMLSLTGPIMVLFVVCWSLFAFRDSEQRQVAVQKRGRDAHCRGRGAPPDRRLEQDITGRCRAQGRPASPAKVIPGRAT